MPESRLQKSLSIYTTGEPPSGQFRMEFSDKITSQRAVGTSVTKQPIVESTNKGSTPEEAKSILNEVG